LYAAAVVLANEDVQRPDFSSLTKAEELNLPNNPPLEEPPQLDIDVKIEDCAGPTIHHPPLVTPPMRRRCKSYDKSMVRQSARLAKHKVLKDLGIVRNDRKLAIQEYAKCVKELLPPDLLESLVHTKGHAFWDLVAGISLPLC
jgi:hypothetical protein